MKKGKKEGRTGNEKGRKYRKQGRKDRKQGLGVRSKIERSRFFMQM